MCHTGNDVSFFNMPNPIVFHTANKREFKENTSKRYISVEIEVASVGGGSSGDKVSPVVKEWNSAIVHDGSLPSTGFEINTAPANGDIFINLINEVCGVLKAQKAKVDNSCGLHVHVDARECNFYDIRKLVYLYDKIETAFFGIVAPSRKTVHYCAPCGKKLVKNLEENNIIKDNKKTIITNVYGSEVNLNTVKTQKYNNARYNALNLHSWVYRGTIENRMHHGTINAEKIINWSLLQAAMLDFAVDHAERDIKHMKGSPLEILLLIAPNDRVKEWIVSRHNYFAGRTRDPEPELIGEI